jgi:hypothetical protein
VIFLKLWVGHEREGDFKGHYTLFIGSETIGINEICRTLKKYPTITQLYFGAGKCTNIKQSVVHKCLKLFPKLHIMLEVRLVWLCNIDNDLFDKVNFILTVNDENLTNLKNMKKQKIQFKLQSVSDENDMILLIQNANKFKEVNMNDFKYKTYKGDVVLK